MKMIHDASSPWLNSVMAVIVDCEKKRLLTSFYKQFSMDRRLRKGVYNKKNTGKCL